MVDRCGTAGCGKQKEEEKKEVEEGAKGEDRADYYKRRSVHEEQYSAFENSSVQ